MLRSIFIYLILGLVLIPRSKIVLAITSQNCISNIHTNHIRDSQLKFFFKVSNDTQQQECKSFRIFLKHVSNHLRQVWGTAIFLTFFLCYFGSFYEDSFYLMFLLVNWRCYYSHQTGKYFFIQQKYCA